MPNHKRNTFHNNGSKHNLLIKFGLFMPHYKKKSFFRLYGCVACDVFICKVKLCMIFSNYFLL